MKLENIVTNQKQNNVAETKESATIIMNKGGSQGTNKAGETQPLDTAGVHLWREEFDKQFIRLCDYCGGTEYKDVHNQVKSFIQQLLTEQLEMVKEEVIGYAVKMDKIADEEANGKLKYHHCSCLKEVVEKQSKLIDKLLLQIKGE